MKGSLCEILDELCFVVFVDFFVECGIENVQIFKGALVDLTELAIMGSQSLGLGK